MKLFADIQSAASNWSRWLGTCNQSGGQTAQGSYTLETCEVHDAVGLLTRRGTSGKSGYKVKS